MGVAADDGDRLGAGRLSAAARARLARPAGSALRPPPIDDLAAVGRWRAEVHAAWLEGDPSAEACGHREDVIAGVRVLRSAPVEDGALILYLHGGGYALGSPEVALPITEALAAVGEVVSVDYRLAPEHPCPAAIEDAVAVFRELTHVADGGRRRVVVAGDSAGANLALSVALSQRDTAGPGSAVAGLILFSPHLGWEAIPGDPPRADRPSDLDDEGAGWLAAAYRGSLPADDPRLSPLSARLDGLPPMLIQVGTSDTCFEHGIRLARRARSAGIEVDLDVWEGMWHTWQYHRDLPEAARALAEAGEFARRLSAGGR